jgi:predicted small secreted protein
VLYPACQAFEPFLRNITVSYSLSEPFWEVPTHSDGSKEASPDSGQSWSHISFALVPCVFFTVTGFLTEAAKLAVQEARDRVLHPVLKAGGAAADAAKSVTSTVAGAGAEAQHDVSQAAHAVQDAAEGTAAAAKHAGRATADKAHDAAKSAKDAASHGLHDAADTVTGAAQRTGHAADHAWTGAQHTLHDKLSHVKRILHAVGKLPSLRPGSVLSGLHHHDRTVGSADSSAAVPLDAAGRAELQPHSAEELKEARAVYIQALHEGLESLQVGVQNGVCCVLCASH